MVGDRLVSKPKLPAKVFISPKSVFVKNVGEKAWPEGIVYLNAPLAGLHASLSALEPGHTAELPLTSFGEFFKGVIFAEKVGIRKVWINVDGYEATPFVPKKIAEPPPQSQSVSGQSSSLP